MMTILSKSTMMLLAGVVLGGVVTLFGYPYVVDNKRSEQSSAQSSGEPKPLYWVAPMDANYRRDKPGKSPMGMDLIPVYEKSNPAEDEGPGTIRISPNVVNNLGVRTALVKRKLLDKQIQTVGYVAYDEDRLVHVHPRVEGWIEKLYIKAAGDPVKLGEPLYDIYSPALVNAQEELLLALDRNNERLIRAAKDRLQALQLPLSAIKAVEKSRKVKQFITFYAPQKGVVDNLNIREGFFVKPGITLMSIGTLEQVWVEAEVFERQAFVVAVGQPVTMTMDYLPGKQWLGSVDYIYPTLNSKTRTVKVRLRFANENAELKPNMFAQIAIHPQSGEPTLLVPKEAVIRSGSADRVVLALGDGRFKSINVALGRFDETAFEILSGLQAGDRVVVSAQFLLDSESSKTSDFRRMHHGDPAQPANPQTNEQMETTKADNSATVNGVINSVMAGHSMLNISREAIEKWGRGPATLDFLVAPEINLDGLSKGQNIRFTFEIKDGEFMITELNKRGQSQLNGGQHD